MKPVNSKLHGVSDYISAAALVLLPRLLRWDRETTRLLDASAAATTGYSLLTDYELGLVKVIPMKGHLGLDVAQSLLLGIAPFLFLKTGRASIAAGLVGISLIESVVILLSSPVAYRK